MTLRIGTRNSDLARAQTAGVETHLQRSGYATELVPIVTAGDRSMAPSFGSIGPQGVFVQEINRALLAGTIDVAVHSYKDLPTAGPDELVVAAVPDRLDPADCLLVRASLADNSRGFLPLPEGARVGTSSSRRQAWLNHFRPDLRTVPLRGNVVTRIRRLQEAKYDAIVLAAAGLHRLVSESAHPDTIANLDGVVVVRLPPNQFVPAPAQGALALQCRRERSDVRNALMSLESPAARSVIDSERLLLQRLEGGCELAFGAYCRGDGTDWVMHAMLERDQNVLSMTCQGESPNAAAETLWSRLDGDRRTGEAGP